MSVCMWIHRNRLITFEFMKFNIPKAKNVSKRNFEEEEKKHF